MDAWKENRNEKEINTTIISHYWALNALDTLGNIVKDQYSHLVYVNICIK